MRNILAFSAALLLTVVGLGWYLDWYRIGTAPSTPGQRRVTIDIDTNKIGSDLQKANQELQQKLTEKNKATTTTRGREETSEPKWEPHPHRLPKGDTDGKMDWIERMDKLIDH